MRILEEFWYGNINPVEIPFQRQRQFDKEFKPCQDEMTQITECQTFIKGFKFGARFIMACFENGDLYTE